MLCTDNGTVQTVMGKKAGNNVLVAEEDVSRTQECEYSIILRRCFVEDESAVVHAFAMCEFSLSSFE